MTGFQFVVARAFRQMQVLQSERTLTRTEFKVLSMLEKAVQRYQTVERLQDAILNPPKSGPVGL